MAGSEQPGPGAIKSVPRSTVAKGVAVILVATVIIWVVSVLLMDNVGWDSWWVFLGIFAGVVAVSLFSPLMKNPGQHRAYDYEQRKFPPV